MEEEQIDETQPAKSKKFLIAIIAAVFLAGLGGGYFFFQRSTPSDAEPEPVAEAHSAASVNAYLPLSTFIVNLAGGGGREFLRVDIELGLTEEAAASNDGGEPPVAEIRDTILGVLTHGESEKLLTFEGKEQLKVDLINALSEHLEHLGVKAVYFNEFLIQR